MRVSKWKLTTLTRGQKKKSILSAIRKNSKITATALLLIRTLCNYIMVLTEQDHVSKTSTIFVLI